MTLINPSSEARAVAHVNSQEKYTAMHDRSLNDLRSFWLEFALKHYWKTPPTLEKCLSYNFDINQGTVFVKWFEDGYTNICYNILDQKVENGLGGKVAILWEGNDSNDISTFTYSDLLKQVKMVGVMLRRVGIKKGDCVAVYMPMIPELIMTMLACARIGAVHSVVFGGFSASSLCNRIIDAKCKVLITCDGTWRGSKLIDLKSVASDALEMCESRNHTVERCIVFKHVTSTPYTSCSSNNLDNSVQREGIRPALNMRVEMKAGRDVWWHDLMFDISNNVDCPVEWMNAEDPLFILYTSGSTGRPKGVVHTTGGYMVYASTTFFYTFDYHDDDIYWCSADCGWITGHSYVVYGPLLNGATTVVYESIPNWPDAGRCWAIIDKYKVTKFYTAPTAIRTLLKAGDKYVHAYSRKSLKILGSVGEPINVSAWEWYYHVVGQGRCSIVDTFWQTETGGHMITPIPGATPMKPGCATKPFFGVDARILSEAGQDLTANHKQGMVEGCLVFAKPWPGMMRTIFGNHQLFEKLYFSRFPGYYIAGDGAKMDEDGDIWITGRLDDMLNSSGHLISTAEVENTLLLDPRVSEAAVVGRNHEVKGEVLHCFVTLKNDTINGTNSEVGALDPKLRQDLIDLVRSKIGPFATPDFIQEAPVLPKTRSGKIIRRLLRKIANNDNDFGDTSTLIDHSCLDMLILLAKTA